MRKVAKEHRRPRPRRIIVRPTDILVFPTAGTPGIRLEIEAPQVKYWVVEIKYSPVDPFLNVATSLQTQEEIVRAEVVGIRPRERWTGKKTKRVTITAASGSPEVAPGQPDDEADEDKVDR